LGPLRRNEVSACVAHLAGIACGENRVVRSGVEKARYGSASAVDAGDVQDEIWSDSAPAKVAIRDEQRIWHDGPTTSGLLDEDARGSVWDGHEEVVFVNVRMIA